MRLSREVRNTLLIVVAFTIGLTPFAFRIAQVRNEENQLVYAQARRSGYDPERWAELRNYLKQSGDEIPLTDEQWDRVKLYMSTDKSAPFRQHCSALARAEAKRGRTDALQALRQRLDDPDGYVVASTLAHLVKWLKVPDSQQILSRFVQDKRKPVQEILEAFRANTSEESSLGGFGGK